ncbi:MAG: FliA/WhiG family RNA polymerase sigma factor [Acidobacteria bacterium]|nr:FliA/WhiG family RNA polymerase sigma factor [Acidobacteriota bacterium]
MGTSWNRHTDVGEYRAELIESHLALVQHAVNGIASRIPRRVPIDELVSAGMLGLVKAARSYDPTRGVPFEGYAITRIRGAVLDELRDRDWASRSVRPAARQVEAGQGELAAQLGRMPTSAEVAEKLGINVVAVQRIIDDVAKASVIHYDAVALHSEPESMLPADERSPDTVLLNRERTAYLRDAVAVLPERMRFVVEAYFFEERKMQEIADELGVTMSRVSQICTEALALLRDGMNAQLEPQAVEDKGSLDNRVARKKAAYIAAVAANSDFKSRIGIEHEPDAQVLTHRRFGGGAG